MNKILFAEQMRATDLFTIQNEPISSLDLMERAAKACEHWLFNKYVSQDSKFVVFCGPGNNGGDGAVIARLLHLKGIEVMLVMIGNAQPSQDLSINLERLKETGCPMQKLISPEQVKALVDGLSESTIIVDSLFGTGLSRPLNGLFADLVKQINRLPNTVISIDIPSGMFCDYNHDNTLETIIEASHTLTFGCLKPAFVLPEAGHKAGIVSVLSIGLMIDNPDTKDNRFFCLNESYIKQLYKPRKKFTHKGHYGHVQIHAGAYGKMGAAVLASRAALVAGAGLITAVLPKCGVDIMQTAVPEVMVLSNEGLKVLQGNFSAVADNITLAIGPGIGTEKQTVQHLESMLKASDRPLVMDADALNILALNPFLWDLIPKQSILTPHPKEFARIGGDSKHDKQKLETLSRLSKEKNIIIILKDAHTCIALPTGKLIFNTTGNPGMATAGSGDVLTGLIAGFLAQDYPPQHAALLAVFLHGKAGDLAAKNYGQEALTASRLIKSFRSDMLVSTDIDKRARYQKAFNL